LLAVIWGQPLIDALRKHNIGKGIRIEGPSTHQVKTGTPTMGGLMILIPVSGDYRRIEHCKFNGLKFNWTVNFGANGRYDTFGILGAVDDLVGVKVIKTGYWPAIN
jgi:phospho-N-acetylmuramoyl-pentapeptide-transferase